MGRAAEFFNPQVDDILSALATANKWTKQESQDAKDWYSHFLELNWRMPGNTVYIVSGRADKLWHEHINHTRRYREYCDACFGFYLDHDPVTTPLLASQLKTVQAAYKEWGIIPDMVVPCAHG